MSKREEMKWAIVHIFSSYNNTLVTATDLSGAETFDIMMIQLIIIILSSEEILEKFVHVI